MDSQELQPESRPLHQHASILNIPQEVLEEILSYLIEFPENGALNLRATCKDLEMKTAKLIGATYFSNRVFLLADEYSLEALQSISSRPVFAKAIRHIEFSVAVMFCHEIDGDDSDSVASDDEDALRAWQKMDAMSRRKAQRKRRTPKHRKPCRQLRREHWRFLRNERCPQYLRTIFANLMAANSIPSISTSAFRPQMCTRDCAELRRGVGFNRLERTIEEANSLPSEDNFILTTDAYDDAEFWALFEAICRTKYPISVFNFGCLKSGVSLHLANYMCGSPSFANLSTFNLTIHPEYNRCGEHGQLEIRGIPESLPRFIDFLRSAPNLRHLRLELGGDEGDESGPFVFQALTKEVSSTIQDRALRNLERMELIEICHSPKDLLTFVHATRSTLKVLGIRDVHLHMSPTPMGPRWARRVRKAYGSEDLQLIWNHWVVENGPDVDAGINYYDG